MTNKKTNYENSIKAKSNKFVAHKWYIDALLFIGGTFLLGILAGFLVPALLPGTTAMHRGYNMYKAGLAIAILQLRQIKRHAMPNRVSRQSKRLSCSN